MYKLNIDPELPYHYFITVASEPATGSNPGRLYLKHGPLKYTNDDVEKVQSAKMLSEDKLYKTSKSDSLKVCDCKDLVHAIWSMLMAAGANQCSVHHFSSDFEMDDDFWEDFVDRANRNTYERDKLNESKINGGGFL